MDTAAPSPFRRFASFEVNLEVGEMRRHGYRIRLQEKPFQILVALLERPGALVTRDELHQRLWPDNIFVDFDHNLNNAINKLRDALNDSSENPRFIETIPRRGYRFLADVEIGHDGTSVEFATPAVEEEVRALSIGQEDEEATQAAPFHIENEHSVLSPRSSWARWLSGLAGLLLASGVGIFYLLRWMHPRPAAPSRAMIVVLPFENLTGDPSQEYFCDGMTEELIAQLGNLDPDRLSVIARTTAMHYKGSPMTIKEIAHELGVEYVLESSIRRLDNHIRVTTQLIHAAEERHLWAQSFDRDSTDLLGLQQSVSLAVSNEIPLHMNKLKGARLHDNHPADSVAYENYLRGRFFWNKRSKEGLNKGIFYFKEAIKEDPQYARAYAGLADSYLVLGGGYMSPHQTYLQGESAATEALARDGDLAEAHTSLAYFKFIDEWDWQGADREFKQAISLDPSYATAHHWYALYLSAMGRQPEAINEIEKALVLDPLSVVINANAGAIYYQSGDYEKSLQQLQKTLELDPNFVPAHGYLGYVYETRRNYAQALTEYKRAQQLSGDQLAYAGDVGWIYALTGRKTEAQALLRPLQDASKGHSDVSAYTFCLIYTSLGDPEEALKWLAKSIEDREFTATEMTHDLRIDALRSNPQFEVFRREFNIPQ